MSSSSAAIFFNEKTNSTDSEIMVSPIKSGVTGYGKKIADGRTLSRRLKTDNFYQRVCNTEIENAVVKSFIELCKEMDTIEYYERLHDHNASDDTTQRNTRIRNSERAMLKYYSAMNFHNRSNIYSSYMDDRKRGIITRWRLSNHCLKIETGRYRKAFIPREQRTCDVCNVLGDETHAVFTCPRYTHIREKYTNLLQRNSTIQLFLNPSVHDANDTANCLIEIEIENKRATDTPLKTPMCTFIFLYSHLRYVVSGFYVLH